MWINVPSLPLFYETLSPTTCNSSCVPPITLNAPYHFPLFPLKLLFSIITVWTESLHPSQIHMKP